MLMNKRSFSEMMNRRGFEKLIFSGYFLSKQKGKILVNFRGEINFKNFQLIFVQLKIIISASFMFFKVIQNSFEKNYNISHTCKEVFVLLKLETESL